ncbi:chemotaxis protein CheW [Marinomonas flavescens]|uniref:chemotaxis protein CheW n=1 Tax=Marinomonas flavescens TaxID=2529379 RepID=UPI0010549F29|nr:chemotaxis protein CheW [Marinomonas flavescens]
MKDLKTKDSTMTGPQLAVQRYLDDLLQEATDINSSDQIDGQVEDSEMGDQAQGIQEIKTDSDSKGIETRSSELESEEQLLTTEVIPESESFHSIETSFADFEAAITDVPAAVLSDSEYEIEADEPEPEPEVRKWVAKTEPLPWASGRFECLLFYVGGLKMAVPLIELGGIFQSGGEKLTSIFGQPDWFMGVANVGEFNLRCVDTARWVMPNHYKGELKENFKFVIQLDRSDWALACEEVAEAISLEPSQVKWRSDRSKRPWLAGTVIDHMCAILDVQGFIELLDDPDNGFKKHL